MKELCKFGGKFMFKNMRKNSLNIFFTVMVILIVLNIFWSKMVSNNIDMRILGNYKIMHVLTGSMSPAIEAGDIIVTKAVDSRGLKKGDIITFRIANKTLITHRIIGINDDWSFVTKGDANNIEDIDIKVHEANIIGKYFIRIPKGGYILKLIQSPVSLMIFILLPIVILAWDEIRSYNKKFKKIHK